MRALLGLLCLCSLMPEDQRPTEKSAGQLSRVAEYSALIAEIAPPRSALTAQGLPDELADAVERWTAGGPNR